MESSLCAQCSTPFTVKKKRVKFCSDDCYNASRKQEIVQTSCAYCSVEIEIPRHAVKDKNYCSKEHWRSAQHLIPSEKACKKCHAVRPIEEFSVNEHGRPHAKCKECLKEYHRSRYSSNIEKERAKLRAQHQKHKARYYLKTKEWRADNKDKIKEYNREYKSNLVKENPEYHREKYHRKFVGLSKEEKRSVIAGWRANSNKDKAKAYCQARRARIYKTAVEQILPSLVFERDGYICYLCGLDLRLTPELAQIEHLIPLSRGGTHTYDNVAASCANCNQRKKAKLPSECYWAKQRLALVLYVQP